MPLSTGRQCLRRAVSLVLLLPDIVFAEEPSAFVVSQGRELYADHCGRCHGANLEGQADWKSPLPSGRFPAPPHDASGHTWHHPDGVLFRLTKDGPAAVVGGGYQSDMPAFDGTLSDDQILAVLAFIKSTWPERERAYQAEVSRFESDLPPPATDK